MAQSQTDLLTVYLNDHLAGATAGVELFRRVCESDTATDFEKALRRITDEIVEDREALLGIMKSLDVPVRHPLMWVAWAVEKVGRLKPNGRIVRPSAITPLIEMEGLALAPIGKRAGWVMLRKLAEDDMRLSREQLDELIARANRQADELEMIRREVGVRALSQAHEPITQP